MKKIVAVILILVLTVAMMMPVFAASVDPRACAHNWQEFGSRVWSYRSGTRDGHIVDYTYNRVCSKCAAVEYGVAGPSSWSSHSIPCGYCGYGVTR